MTLQVLGIIDPSFGVNAMGGSSYVPGLPLLPSSSGLTAVQCLGVFDTGLAGFDAVEKQVKPEPRTENFKQVLIAATMPGSAAAGRVAHALAQKSLSLANVADARAQVTQDSRVGYQRALRQVGVMDNFAEQALAEGRPDEAAVFRAEGFNQARLAIRYQKVNALATGMTQNAAAQAQIAQKLAQAVLAGRPDVAAVLGVTYDKLGAHSDELRDIRAAQVQKAELQGFGDLDDIFEGELNGLEALEGKFLKKLKKVAHKIEKIHEKINPIHKLAKKYVVKPLKKKVLTPIKNVTIKAAKKVGQVAAKVTIGLGCKLAKTKLVGQVIGMAGQAVGTFYGGPVGGAVGKRAADRAHDTTKAMCGALDKIGITKGQFHKGAVRGALKGAATHIVKQALDPREAFKTLTSVGGSYLGGAAGSAGGAGNLLSKVTGGGGGSSSGVLSTLVKGAGGKVDLLGTFSKGGGGGLLSFGQDAFAKVGLQNMQGQYLNRMKQVAAEQISGRLQTAAKQQVQAQAGALLRSAVSSNFSTQAFTS